MRVGDPEAAKLPSRSELLIFKKVVFPAVATLKFQKLPSDFGMAS